MAESAGFRRGDALIIVDVQKDFCPGGALPIEEGDSVIPFINECIRAASARGVPIYVSRDWHPENHLSFEAQGGPWPVHCVQDTGGAAFHPALRLPGGAVTVTKGTRFDYDQNSAFDATGLDVQLRKDGIERLWVTGLAEDVCVKATVLDGLDLGFEVIVPQAGTRPVTPQGGEEARAEMRAKGADLRAL